MMLQAGRLKNHCGPQPPGFPERAGFARDGVEAPPAELDNSKGEKQGFIPSYSVRALVASS